MTSTSTTPTAPTVADIVTERPAAALVFERYGIDYCCHGDRPLTDACADAGIEVPIVQAELDTLGATDAPATASVPVDDVGGLIGYIVSRHHTYLRRALPRLHDVGTKVIAAHGERHPEVVDVAATVDALAADLLPHLAKEEKVLFPLTIELLGAVEPTTFHCGSISNPLRVMDTEHDEVGRLLAVLRTQTGGYRVPDDACPTWRAWYDGLAELEVDVHTHVHLENNVLFPLIRDLEARLAA